MSFKKRARISRPNPEGPLPLAQLRKGEHGILERVDLPADEAQRIMELGFLPGMRITVACCAPGGDPRIYRVDGSEVAIRRETALRLVLRHHRCDQGCR